jgi:hypothetical protein
MYDIPPLIMLTRPFLVQAALVAVSVAAPSPLRSLPEVSLDLAGARYFRFMRISCVAAFQTLLQR